MLVIIIDQSNKFCFSNNVVNNSLTINNVHVDQPTAFIREGGRESVIYVWLGEVNARPAAHPSPDINSRFANNPMTNHLLAGHGGRNLRVHRRKSASRGKFALATRQSALIHDNRRRRAAAAVRLVRNADTRCRFFDRSACENSRRAKTPPPPPPTTTTIDRNDRRRKTDDGSVRGA